MRDYVHVIDLARGPVVAPGADLGPAGSRVYNLGTGSAITVLQVVAAASEAVGSPIRHEMAGWRLSGVETSWADYIPPATN